MTEDLSRSPSRHSNSHSGRSLVSRLASPFTSKTRPFTDFTVDPDDLHRTYSPGDTVTGSVRIKVLKAFRVTHVTLCLHGFVQVFRHPNDGGNVYRFPHAGRRKSGGEYFGNGYASLFEDEIVLCGEGRLGEGIYQFNFEMDFPNKGLPSSIDFERGTISYMLTASLTRPTTISPVAYCDRKLKFLEMIDIAPLAVPKPREVSLKAVSKRSRVKQMSKLQTEHIHTAERSSPDPACNNQTSSIQDGSQAPGSPCPSEISFDSFASSGGRNSHVESVVRSSKTSDSGRTHANTPAGAAKIITANVELLKPGGLRGDHIPLRITVNHIKYIKSLHGVIVTMYRQARVDMHPILPLGPMKKGEKEKYEDYYPRSVTGLGGLSLSAAGSSQIFRKDLSQSFTPLIVDPTTLTADVKAAVRIPDEAFPSISGVPGAMISFQYYIEVVLDLQGKLAGQDRFIPSTGLLNQSTSFGSADGGGYTNDGTQSGPWTANIIDTEPIRREKSIVSCVFEIIIGTKDSERRGKRRAEATQEPGIPEHARSGDDLHEVVPPGDSQEPYGGEQWAANYYGDGYGYGQYQDWSWDHYQIGQSHDSQGYLYPNHDNILQQQNSIPNLAEQEAHLPEKERLRRAEERLLPSQPPASDGDGPPLDTPSAPPLADGPMHLESGSTLIAESPQALAHSNDHIGDFSSDMLTAAVPGASEPAPRYSTLAPASGTLHNVSDSEQPHDSFGPQLPPTDDKQELHRRRLQMEASSPNDMSELDDDGRTDAATVRAVPTDDRPSAPVIPDDIEEDAGLPEGLPRYER
ncbi:hypothetical protein EV356DRAFT_528607 [Viridothelium virens]|uniref:Arrestin-like N-terminal domain-containing protein n=1 Tax=Viridothelium virens TaxID=1048519 RepID=A0A6A6HPD9_VIRVR|nr:hypothetical protein EV356DRAFT_528607 [Viridothelium virens]